MKLLIADDHELIAASLENLIIKTFQQFKIYKAYSKETLFSLLETHPFDLLIQDIRFGKDNAIDFIPDIIKKYPACKLIVLTSISDAYTIKTIMKFKPQALLLKTESIDTISSAIELVLSNSVYYSKSILNINEPNQVNFQQIVLSRREREILNQILMEKNIQQIAESLFISAKTVEMHRANLFIKLNVKNITGLVKKALLLNLIDDL